MTWYKIERYSLKISPVKVVRETEKTVTTREDYYGNPREFRHLKGGEFFPSFEEAQKHLTEIIERQMRGFQVNADRCRNDLNKVKEMKQP